MTVEAALGAALTGTQPVEDEAEVEPVDTDLDVDDAAGADTPGSVLAALRARAHDAAAAQTIDLPLPWFHGMLVGRYQAIPLGRVYRTNRQGQALNPVTDPWLAADNLALACVELLQTDGEGGPLETIGDYPCRYDDSLADALHLDVPERSARAVMYALYANSGRAEALIVTHFMQYFAWLTGDEGAALEVADDAVGEYQAG